MKTVILLFSLLISSMSLAQKTEYYRQLRYNHVSPFINIVGIHKIDSVTASNTSHYIFKYSNNRLSEIINNHYHTEKKHPLASLGVYKVVFNYQNDTETRTFYSLDNKRMANDKGVYKESYTLDENGFKKQLKFYDEFDKPMESNWQIAEYKWQKKDSLVIEKRYNSENEFANLSPYFEFGITGILLKEKGQPKAHFNLNEQLEIIDNSYGVASYQDTYDELGNHTLYTYHNKNNQLVMNQWNYAIGKKEYDDKGNHIKLKLLDTKGKVINIRKLYSNSKIKLSPVATKKDSLSIKKVALGYLQALQKLKPELMNKVLNDSLNKITIGYDSDLNKQYGKATPKSQMIAYVNNWNASGTRFPFSPNNEVKILDIYNRIASVKLISDNWVEYLQLIKLDGNWEIMNLIWQYKDVRRYGD